MELTKKVYLLGVFDMIHQAHLNLIHKAAYLGELHIGVVKDKAVKRQKGDDRPIVDEKTRLNIIKALDKVHSAELIDDFEFPKYVLEFFPIVLVGEDQQHIKNIDKIDFMSLYKMPRMPGVSTTDIVRKIKNES